MSNRAAVNLLQSRAGGKTERCHNIPHHGSYSVAAHSWGVAMLMHYIWPEDFPRLALYCLSHDVPEAWVGDIPSPTLRYTPGLGDILACTEATLNRSIGLPAEKDLNYEDLGKLKACDRLEFWLWAREQLAMGNRFAQEGKTEIERYFKETPLPKAAQELYEELRNTEVLPRQQGILKEMNYVS